MVVVDVVFGGVGDGGECSVGVGRGSPSAGRNISTGARN